ncbi:Oidioi.mRNA.OKI2018_I69.chr2.g7738.t1.cds [Oikopleura dioica]|uniref:Oidioi.mRNA.OKI2018_I69.chr2.g7738.t1.cds n=1 Tax=Oikopleura dioica TaxID=34765 RepID=A0ABN7T741_OIKDI|nr:Oidioi.mRNA.OKI2018_I69.chr2.g7738.t1.cds [Oikopleura dioica]
MSGFEPKQKGYFSDVLNENAPTVDNSKCPEFNQSLQWASSTEGETPKVDNIPEMKSHGRDTRRTIPSQFAEQSSLPKVQTPWYIPPGQEPRKLAIERRKRQYRDCRGTIEEGKLNSLLEKHNINLEKIYPDPEALEKFCLPLEVFDNNDWDERTPEEWNELRPLPCRVYIEELGWRDGAALELVEGSASPGNSGDWRVAIEENGEVGQVELPRILVLFHAENPMHFVNRLVEAYHAREKTELLLQQQLYIDSMPRERAPILDDQMIKVVHRNVEEEYADEIAFEVEINMQRAENSIMYQAESDSNPALFEALHWRYQQKLAEAKKNPPKKPQYFFQKAKNEFNFSSLLTRAEVIDALGRVREECNKVIDMQLFNTNTGKPLRINEFEQSQMSSCTTTTLYLGDPWVSAIKGGVRGALQYMGKGWFNLKENNYHTYSQSKMFLLLNVIRFNMQDALRYLVEGSCTNFVEMITDCCDPIQNIPQDFEWGPELKISNFVPERAPFLLMELQLGKEEVSYKVPYDDVIETIIKIFDQAINGTQAVPHIERGVVDKIFWKGNSLLESVGKNEPHIIKMREVITEKLGESLDMLKAYAKEFNQFLEFFNLKIPEYLQTLNLDEMSAKDIKAAVDEQFALSKKVLAELPSNLVIGPYFVVVESVRQNIAKKHKQLGDAILELLVQKLRTQGDEACNLCKNIQRRLGEKPMTIEDLADMREYMETVPAQLEELTLEVQDAVNDYDLIEEFYYPLSQDDFNVRWEAVFFPGKLEKLLEATYGTLDVIEQDLKKIQMKDTGEFHEKLESMQMAVAGFSAYTDPAKANEVANEVRRTVKSLNECQESANKYNARERLFEMPVTDYSKIQKLQRQFQPFKDLWSAGSDWSRWSDTWFNDSLSGIDPELLEKQVDECFRTFHKAQKSFKDVPAVLNVASNFKQSVEAFKPYVPLIQGLRNQGMRIRHWEQLSEELGFKISLKKELTFQKCLDMKLDTYTEQINKVSEVAAKEYAIETALDKMEEQWRPILFEVLDYKDTGTYIIKSPDEASQLLDDHIVMTQSMNFSPFKKPFEERIQKWELTLRTTQDVLDEWLTCQRSWLYLEPIFSSDDINRQLPVEAKRYQTMDRAWRKIMKNAFDNPKVIEICADQRLCDKLKECNMLLEQVQKGLSEYLETKRMGFPRFFFLSDDELLEILSQTKDPTAVQPHLRKCFENIARITFGDDLRMTEMTSAEGETVAFSEEIYPRGNVEDWLTEVERVMGASVREFLRIAVEAYPQMDRNEWVLKWPGQVVIAGCQTYWAQDVENAIKTGTLSDFCEVYNGALSGLVHLVRGKLTGLERMILSALIVIEVHARDVTLELNEQNIASVNDFEWISQLRYYWYDGGLFIRAVNAEFPYGYEYLGNSGRLVITPLTDRCYLTLTGALHLKFGGAPAGPAGTGKTETTKDLGKALAVQCVVFNCSDQLDFMAMGKFLKGLASTGAWACFDEFNRIDIEVLSVVAQQVMTIQKAQIANAETFIFEGVEIRLINSCAVFITMNPGYAGRTELPDNLKALFRPVAMMVPNYTMIAEISLYSFGFDEAKVLAHKITATFKLSSEQLSSQDHYDFGMRAVKTVISAAGNLKREHPEMNEELICLRAIRDVNVPKFLLDDLKLFRGIVSDLFPGIKEEEVDYGSLLEAIQNACYEDKIKPVEGFVNKCIQLYETTVVRHGLMLVGPTISGKTKCSQVLAKALTSLKGEDSISGGVYEEVHIDCLNPKSITMGQLYGEFDPMTHEWTDGILSTLIRQGCGATNSDKRWYMFDGPVDAVWIENMNTVLDDNKKLCLSSGEIIKLTPHMTMMFEVADLAVASPATVSRCGMVYLEPGGIGLEPFVDCWISQLPPGVDRACLKDLFDTYMEPSIDFVRRNLKEIVTSVNGNLVFSLLNLLDTFVEPLRPKETGMPAMGVEGGKRVSVRRSTTSAVRSSTSMKRISPVARKRLDLLAEPWFIFSLIWSIGGTTDSEGRSKFDEFLRKLMAEKGAKFQFPEDGEIYDFVLADDSLGLDKDDDEEDDFTPEWVSWLTKVDEYTVPEGANFTEILVPTIDTIRQSIILGQLVNCNKQVLAVGPTGTGKSVVISDKLLTGMSDKFIPNVVVFSAKTSANQTQDLIDSKLDKRRKGIFGPPISKYAVFFIDDFNMPALEEYGAQPPIEIIRQWMDYKGWYDRKAIGSFRNLVDIGFVCAMGPPGGGRNPVTARLLRHFNQLAFTEMGDKSKARIFGKILDSWLPESLLEFKDPLVNSTIDVYGTVCKSLLPTPAKSHYTFNLRDLAKVFQGMLMHAPKEIEDVQVLTKLWFHEACRVFSDRLINNEDRTWFEDQLKGKINDSFGLDFNEVAPHKPVIFADFVSNNGAYQFVKDHKKMINVMTESLEDYNEVSQAQMKLVLFMDAAQHVSRISRIIRQPLGNALLLGLGGSGRQSLTRLAAHLSDYECFQIQLAKNYGVNEWREDIKKVMMQAGLQQKATVFLFSDTQIKDESFLEDINGILNSGDVPNIYAQDELDKIYNAMKSECASLGLVPTKSNMFSVYTRRVKANLHTVVCMSPIGDIFRARLRQFPSLITCCTIDWFTEWPDEALRSVANTFIADTPVTEDVLKGIIDVCMQMHQSVAVASERFKAELQRHNYVTPTAYLDLLALFNKLYGIKIDEVRTQRDRMKVGLDKLLKTAEDVAVMQVELEEMQPELKIAQEKTAETMVQIEKIQSLQTRQKQLLLCKNKKDAQRDLDEALPALEAATKSLKSLNTSDVVEVRAMQRPPPGVRMVIEAVCIMFEIKPKMVAGEQPGKKVADYWEPGKALLQAPPKFLESLFKYDKDNIPEHVITKIAPYIESEDFQPAAIAKASKACTSICMWVRAMDKYHHVAKAVEPKRQALAGAQAELAEAQEILQSAQAKLAEVEAGLNKLNADLHATVAKKEELERNTQLCQDRLVRADKLIGGLAGEKVRWAESITK